MPPEHREPHVEPYALPVEASALRTVQIRKSWSGNARPLPVTSHQPAHTFRPHAQLQKHHTVTRYVSAPYFEMQSTTLGLLYPLAIFIPYLIQNSSHTSLYLTLSLTRPYTLTTLTNIGDHKQNTTYGIPDPDRQTSHFSHLIICCIL